MDIEMNIVNKSVDDSYTDSEGENKLFTAKFPPHIFEILSKYSKEDFSNKTQIAIRAIQFFDRMRKTCQLDPFGDLNTKIDRLEKNLKVIRGTQKKFIPLVGTVPAILRKFADQENSDSFH